MATFVLIPGAFHNGWCFADLQARLCKMGHRALAPDLPGMGGSLPAAELTLDLWVSTVADIVVGLDEAPIVVGHSRGGIVVSQLAELIPDALRETVYLAAALLPDGAVPLDGLLRHMPPGTTRAQLPDFLEPPPFDIVRQTAFSGCDEATAVAAYAQLLSEPVGPLQQPLRLTPERFGRVARTYIETTHDEAVPLAEQRAMRQALPCGRVFQIASDHSPFQSACANLAGTLETIAHNPCRPLYRRMP